MAAQPGSQDVYKRQRLDHSNYLINLLSGLQNTNYSVRSATINSLYPVFNKDNYEMIRQQCEAALVNEQERAIRMGMQELLDTMERELS